MSERLKQQLKKHEGVRTHAYACSENKITVGVGRNLDSDGGIGLSEDEINYLLENDIWRCMKEVASFPWFSEINEARQDAIINMCFNLGISRLRNFKNALASMEEHDYEMAADHFLDSRWAQQVGNRAVEVTEMIRTGQYPE